MRKYLILLIAFFLLAPSLAFSDAFSLKVAYFVPRFDSDLWEDEFYNMSFEKINFHNTSISFAYEYFFNNQLSLQLGVDTYSRKKVGNYKEYIGVYEYFAEGDFAFPLEFEQDFPPKYALPVSHVFSVTITPIQVSLKLAPMGRRNRFIPYIGGGVGVYLWNVRLQGDAIDFSDDTWEYTDTNFAVQIYPVYLYNIRDDNKISFGYHAYGGFMFPVGRQLSIDAEFKFNFVTGNLTDFEGFEPFDLSGYQFAVGISYWF